jgi:HSP20 family protein
MVDFEKLATDRAGDFLELLITAELPGVDEKDVEVTVSGDTLTIRAEKEVAHEEKGDGGRYVERRTGVLSRSIWLPFGVNDEELDATFDEGVLTIRLQKLPEAQKTLRRTEVKRTRKEPAQG